MPDTVIVKCPSCGARYRVDPSKLGKTFACAKCKQPFEATDSASPPVPAPVIAVDEIDDAPAPSPVFTRAIPPAIPASSISYATPAPNMRTSGMAIASLVCGIMFCVPFAGILAIVFGIIGINQTKNEQAKGRGMAIAGTVLGSAWLVLTILALLVSILLPSLNHARGTANRALCASNMHQIGLALIMYQNANRNESPPDLATLWQQEPQLSGSTFVCPESTDTPAPDPAHLTSGGHLSYVYRVPQRNDPQALVLYETSHQGSGMNMLFGDGHVEWRNPAGAAAAINAATAPTSFQSPFHFQTPTMPPMPQPHAFDHFPVPQNGMATSPPVDAVQFLQRYADADQAYAKVHNGRYAKSSQELVGAGLLTDDQAKLGARQHLYYSGGLPAVDPLPADVIVVYISQFGSDYTALFGDWQVRTVSRADWRAVHEKSIAARHLAATQPQ